MVYDIVVSGLGPAGLSFLKSLGNCGLKIIAFDKFSFPRKKPCAGGLTPKAYTLLKNLFPNLDKVVKVASRKFILVNNLDRTEISTTSTLTYLTDREELDNFLLETVLKKSSFEFHFEEAVLSVEKEESFWKVITDKGVYRTRVLISADDVNSRIARTLRIKRDVGFTFESDVETSWDDSILIDFTDFSWGYYWVFPKGNF
ncbi:MAG: hypothetical protein ABGX27_04220 [Desulfurobacteriaceae bacterium]